MTEEEAEEGITPEIIEPSKELAIKIKEFNLAPTDASFLLGKHEQDFKNVAIWAKKASKIIVTDESQTVIMQEARTGRLFLASIRNEVERNRKTLKEDSLRRGKAIDGVANFIKDLIIPTEEHLKRQEDFVELREKAKNDKIIAEAKAKEEAELLAKQQAEKDELERLRKEKQDQMKKEADLQREKLALKQASDNQKLINYRTKIKSLIDEFPEIKDPALIRWSEDAKSYLWLAHSTLNQVNNEEEE